jgi:homoserine O-acetyltransferase
MGGNYTQQPPSWQFASIFYGTATIGGNQGLPKIAPTSDKGDALLKQRLSAPFAGDANDHLYQWESSKDYDPSAGLERIQASVLVINSADDERNPPELGVIEKALPRIKRAKALIIPGSPDTFGHGTTGNARFWKQEVADLLLTTPKLAR